MHRCKNSIYPIQPIYRHIISSLQCIEGSVKFFFFKFHPQLSKSHLIFVTDATVGVSVKFFKCGEFYTYIEHERDPCVSLCTVCFSHTCVILHTVCNFTHNVVFYAKCLISHTMCNFTLFCREGIFVANTHECKISRLQNVSV